MNQNEKKSSNHGYPPTYTTPKPIAAQVQCLLDMFPEIVCDNIDVVRLQTISEPQLPTGAEGCFCIPKWERIAPTYSMALTRVFKVAESTRIGGFHNIIEIHELDFCNFRQVPHTKSMLRSLSKEQDSFDILVIPAQFGFRHRGRSVRRVREAMRDTDEFGLGAFAVGIMILTHPGRLESCNDLRIDCPGDEIESTSDFRSVPCISYRNREAGIGVSDPDFADQRCGSVSGFLFQK